MSLYIGTNLIAKPVLVSSELVQAKKVEKTTNESQTSIETAVQGPRAEVPSSPFVNVITLPTNIPTTEEAVIAVDDYIERLLTEPDINYTDDVPEMKNEFEEVPVYENDRVDETDSDSSNDQEQQDEKGQKENKIPNSDVLIEEAETNF